MVTSSFSIVDVHLVLSQKMVFLSTNTFSFHSQTHVYFSKTPNYRVLISTNQPSISFPKFQSITACNPVKISQSSTPTTLITHLLSAHKIIPTFLTKNAVKLLIGSLILVGSLSCKPVRAVPVENGVNLEEKETQKENVEDEEMYVKLVEQEPRNVEALKVLVTVKMRLGKTKEAVKYVERLVGIEPQEVEWRLLQALCYEMLGNLSKAKKLFHEILIKRPLLLRALHGLAMVMHKNNEGAAVFDMLNRALELAIRDKRVTEERNIKILIAQMHLVKGNFDEALNKYGDLIKENPRDFRPYLCQGIIYSLLDKRKEADEQFEIYRNLVPEEFPERGFLEDVVLAAKTESREQLEKEFNIQSSYKR